MQIKKRVSGPSRTGRHLQRYNQGFRQVVGCIPYRFRKTSKSPSVHGKIEDLEVLLITSQKSPRMMFPKGGWELDENIELAAERETLEEAGVVGSLGEKLGEWKFKSNSQEKFHEGTMFPLLVTEELDVWPEQNVRQRIWMTVSEAREACAHPWMQEALEAFVRQFAPPARVEEEPLTSCRLSFVQRRNLRPGGIGGQTADEDAGVSPPSVDHGLSSKPRKELLTGSWRKDRNLYMVFNSEFQVVLLIDFNSEFQVVLLIDLKYSLTNRCEFFATCVADRFEVFSDEPVLVLCKLSC